MNFVRRRVEHPIYTNCPQTCGFKTFVKLGNCLFDFQNYYDMPTFSKNGSLYHLRSSLILMPNLRVNFLSSDPFLNGFLFEIDGEFSILDFFCLSWISSIKTLLSFNPHPQPLNLPCSSYLPHPTLNPYAPN